MGNWSSLKMGRPDQRKGVAQDITSQNTVITINNYYYNSNNQAQFKMSSPVLVTSTSSLQCMLHTRVPNTACYHAQHPPLQSQGWTFSFSRRTRLCCGENWRSMYYQVKQNNIMWLMWNSGTSLLMFFCALLPSECTEQGLITVANRKSIKV